MPLVTTLLTTALWPTSVRSRSVKVTAMSDAIAPVPVCSTSSVFAMALMAGASVVPVIVMTTSFVVEVLALSVAVTV